MTPTAFPTAFDIELDELTLARAKRGDITACESLYRLFNQPAYAIAYRVCRCPQLAQDVTQEAFISAFRRLKQFRGDSPFWGWLRRVVVNHAISAMRRQPNSETVTLEDYHASQPAEEHQVDLVMDLESAFSRLDGDDRTVVWLHDVEGFNHKEIAELFGMTESFSKTRLSRARARLRDWLDPSLRPAAATAGTENGPSNGPGDAGKQETRPDSHKATRQTERAPAKTRANSPDGMLRLSAQWSEC